MNNSPWQPLARRGRLDLAVLTAARVREAGLTLLGGDFLLMVVTPDDGEPALLLNR